jgi:HK97 gp10 family phage protein
VADIDLAQMNRLLADMTAAPREAEGQVRVVVQKGAADIKRDAKIFAPVGETGDLRASIGYETRITGDAVEAEIGPTVHYGHYVELGTTKMAPRAYMGPAFDRNAHLVEDALGQILDGLL